MDEIHPSDAGFTQRDFILTPLPPRYQRVARLIAQGHSNKEIAGRLAIKAHTVELYASDIYRLLRVRGRTDLVRLVLTGEREDTC